MQEKFIKNENFNNKEEGLSSFDLSKPLELQRTLHFDLQKINDYTKNIISEQDEMTEHFINTEYYDIFKRSDIYGESVENGLPVHIARQKVDQKILELNKELEKIGVGVEKVDISDTYSKENIEEVDPYIADGKKFLTYLQSINEAELSETQKESLQEFLEQLRTQIFNAHHEQDQRLNHFLNALPYIQDIIDNAKRLNLVVKDPVGLEYELTDISDSIEPIKNHYLKEFAISRRSYLYARVIGPMWWHNNKKATEYKEILDSITDDLNKISENKNAKPLFEKMKTDFIETLNKLHAIIQDRPKEWEKINTNAELLPLIERALDEINKLSWSG